jgi:thiol-disulfide isomerase/thioredoxin
MKKFLRSHFIVWLLLSLLAVVLSACTAPESKSKSFEYSEDRDTGNLVLYVFWGDGCPHCETAKPFLARLDQKYPNLNIRGFEIWNSEKNNQLYKKMADTFKLPEGGRGTPTFFIGSQYMVGFSDEYAVKIEEAVKACAQSGCADAGAGIMPGALTNTSQPAEQGKGAIQSEFLDIPLFGKVDLSKQSLWVSTLLIAIVDGVNPCSVWVLTMLLALTLHTGSRKKVVVIGLIFLTVTALIYALFIAGLFTVLSVVSFVGWIQVLVSLLALFFAVVNIKDYFWYKEGLSFTIADDQKPGIFQRIRKVMDASQSFGGLAASTVLMAAGVSLIEFSCTAGFPVLWTNLLVSQKVTLGSLLFVGLLVLYMLIYQLDELVIFFTAVYTLKASRLEDSQGRILKLVGGILMLVLAGVMLINPELMNSFSSSLIIFALAAALVLLVLLVHRKILPAFGIWIGTEAAGKKNVTKRKNKR